MSCFKHASVSTDFSSLIDSLLKMAVKHSFRVDMFAGELGHVGGRIHYGIRLIEINECCAGCMMETLVHEIGHMLHFLSTGMSEAEFESCVGDREQEADRRAGELFSGSVGVGRES